MLEDIKLAWSRFLRKVPPAPPNKDCFHLLGYDRSEKFWFKLGTFRSQEALRIEAVATLKWVRERGMDDRFYLQDPQGALEEIWRDEKAVFEEA